MVSSCFSCGASVFSSAYELDGAYEFAGVHEFVGVYEFVGVHEFAGAYICVPTYLCAFAEYSFMTIIAQFPAANGVKMA